MPATPSDADRPPIDPTVREEPITQPTLDASQQRRADEVERWLRQQGGASEFPPVVEPVPVPPPRLPTVPGYEVVEEVGRGGMGVVYKARHLELDRIVALKMLRGAAYAGPEEQARFRAE